MRSKICHGLLACAALAGILTVISGMATAQAPAPSPPPQPAPALPPSLSVDLMTAQGAGALGAQWKTVEAKIVEGPAIANHMPGYDKSYDLTPHAGEAGFDDSSWPKIEPKDLAARRGGGKVSFLWYRTNLTIPAKIGDFDPTGGKAVLTAYVDDYAEVWVNGSLPAIYGQSGGPVIKGYNAPNRLIIARNAIPGQKIQLAVFGINGPISASPNNFIWIKSAVLDFYKAGAGNGVVPVETHVLRKDPGLDAILTPGTMIERLAAGFQFTEGPVWDREGGYLLFSDPNNNLIYRWSPDGEVSVYRSHSGYTGFNVGEYGQPGSNGLTLDREGRLTINEHGNRRVTRLEKNGVLTVLADRYQGKRLNSPNDLVYRSDGALYFTDPPFGLPKFFEDPRKELPFSGVFCLINGELKLVSTDLDGPNGLAFSPDEKFLYVDNWEIKRKIIMRYEVRPDGSLSNGKVFFDATAEPGEDAWDGMKVDQEGNLYLSGPGGLWIISAEGKHLGTIAGPEHPHNMAWGDEDGKTLYLCARTGLYRIRFKIAGIRP